jgi:hypothetical protein
MHDLSQHERVLTNIAIVSGNACLLFFAASLGPWRYLYTEIVPGHESPVMAEILGDDQLYLFGGQALIFQFLAELLGMVAPESVGTPRVPETVIP